MAEPDKRKPITRRRMAPISMRYTAPADAVNETMRVSGLAPEQMAQRQMVVEENKRMKEQQAKQQQARRDQYRARRRAQDQSNGIILSLPMSDEQVDFAMAQEAHLANQPQFRQGYSESERQARRQAGLLYTQEDMEQAKRLAEAHNASFFGSMVAPPISPEMAERNPGYVQQVIRGDASVLPNAFISGLSFGTPSAGAAVANGVRQGWQTVGNVGTRAWNATVQGAKSAAPVVSNPRWAATTAAVTAPAIADANNPVAGDGGSTSGGEAIPYLLGATMLGAGIGGYKGFRTLKNAGWNWKVFKPGAEGRAIRAASKAPVAERAVVPYVGAYQKPGWLGMKSWWERPVTTAEKSGLPKPTTGQRVMAQVRNWGVRAPLYYTAGSGLVGAGFDLMQKGRHPDKPNEWFWLDKLTYPSIGAPRDIGKGILGTMDQIQYNDSTSVEKPQAEMQSEQQRNTQETDSTDSQGNWKPIPVSQKAYTTEQEDSIMNSLYIR